MKFIWKTFPNPQGKGRHGDLEKEPSVPSSGVPEEPAKPEGKKAEIAEETKQGTHGLSLDVRQAQAREATQEARAEVERANVREPETIKSFERIKKAIEKNEKIPEADWRTLRTALTVFTGGLLHEKQNPGENLFPDNSTPETFLQVLDAKRRHPSENEQDAYGILKSLTKKKDHPDYECLLKEWPQIISLAKQAQPGVQALVQAEKTGLDAPIPAQEKQTMLGKCKEWYQKQPTFTKLAIWAGAATAFYFVGKWLWGKIAGGDKKSTDEAPAKKEKTGFFEGVWGAFKIAGVAILGALTFGYLKKHLPDWLKQDEELYQSLTTRLKVEKATLERIQKAPLKKFMKGEDTETIEAIAREWGVSADLSAYGRSEIPVLGWQVPFIGAKKSEVDKVRDFLSYALENEAVKKKLAEMHVDINSETTTLNEVFAVLNQMEADGTLPKEFAKKPEEKKEKPAETPENDPEQDEALETADKTLVAYSTKAFKELKDTFQYDAPHITRVLDSWEKRGLSQSLLHFPTFISEFLAAAKKETNVFVVIESSGRILVSNGVKCVVLTQYHAFVDTAKEAFHAMVSEGICEGAKEGFLTYLKHTWAFAVIGGILGGLKGNTSVTKIGSGLAVSQDKSLLGRAIGAGKGSLRGVLFPVEAAYREYRLGKWAVRTAKEGNWKFRRIHYGPEIDGLIATERMKFYGRQYLDADRIRNIALGTEPNPLLRRMKPIAEHGMLPDIEADLERSATRYARAHNEYYAAEIAAGTKQQLRWDPKINERFRDFPNALRNNVQSLDDALFAEGIAVSAEKEAGRLRQLGVFWGKLKSFVGPACAALTIWHIEKADDKRKALGEVGAGFATFMAGASMVDRTLGRIIKNPALRGVFDVLGGLGASYGLTESIADIVKNHILNFPGATGASNEALGIIEAYSTKVLAGFGGKMALKGAEKFAGEAVTKFFARKIESKLLKRITIAATKTGIKKLLPSLGWRGAVLGATVADDAIPLIGLVDEVVAIGFAAWMAKDICDLIEVVRTANKMKKIMTQRSGSTISLIDITSPPQAKQEWKQMAQSATGITENSLSQLLEKYPDIQMEVKRENQTGYEQWTMVKGEIQGLTVFDNSGAVLASVSETDAFKAAARAFPEAEEQTKTTQQQATNDNQKPAIEHNLPRTG